MFIFIFFSYIPILVHEYIFIQSTLFPVFLNPIYIYIYIYIYIGASSELYEYAFIFVYNSIGLVGSVFANHQGHLGSIPGRVIPKTQKMVLNTSSPNTRHYKVLIKGKRKQSRERSSALLYTLVL